MSDHHSLKHDKLRKQYIRVFNHFDRDGDGKISPSDLLHCIQSSSVVKDGVEIITMEEIELLVQATSKDKDGTIGLEEFICLAEDDEEEERINSLREAFKMYEMDGSGRITDKSLKRMLSKLGDKRSVGECRAMISVFDLDGDGALDFDEFKVMMA